MANEYYEVAATPYYLELGNNFDERGSLISIEFSDVPFEINRYFFISVLDLKFTRGKHAHKLCWQLFTPKWGDVIITTKNLGGREEFALVEGSALVVPPFNWCEIKFKNEITVLNVLASHPYDPLDYIFVEPTSTKNGL
jgi:UDP-2-acetamido-3-amino-2,3-dideoxy-glucuronate N-acetyltransferase